MRRISIFGTLFFVLLTIAIGYLSNGFRNWDFKEWISRPTTSETVSSNTLSDSIANSSIEVTTSSNEEEKDNFGDNTYLIFLSTGDKTS